jgi:ribosomal protein L32
MAVPKKKISYSRTRKRFLSKKEKFTLYSQCKSCSNFVRLHHLCPSCSIKGVSLSLQQVRGNFKTNINNLYKIAF